MCEGFTYFNAFRNVQHMDKKLNYFGSTLKLFKYPLQILFYSAIVFKNCYGSTFYN